MKREQASEIVEKILTIKDGLDVSNLPNDPNYLIQIIDSLAIYKMSLGQVVAENQNVAMRKEKHRKFKEAELMTKYSMDPNIKSIAAAKVKVQPIIRELELEEIECLEQANLLSILRQDTSDLIGALRSHLSYLKGEQNE